ncbi:MAG: glycosyltransferase [Clostridiales bacterium]|nr:glycosyltransferase [Clostridiales bacterium]
MSKKILLTATELHLSQFWAPHIKNFIDNGYSVDIVCSNVSNKLDILKNKLGDLPVSIDVVDLARSPFRISNFNGYRQIKKMLAERHYDIIMTNEPVMGVFTRLAAKKYRKYGTKVLYTAHGFHFFTGAPKLNWMIFYPIEKWLAKYTDALVTINTEDYDRAKRKFNARDVFYIPGIGIDVSCYSRDESARAKKRAELGLSDDDIMLFSVAELTKRKNLEVAVKAMAKIKSKNVKYFVRGEGILKEYLVSLTKELGVEDKIFFSATEKIYPKCAALRIFLFFQPCRRDCLLL